MTLSVEGDTDFLRERITKGSSIIEQLELGV